MRLTRRTGGAPGNRPPDHPSTVFIWLGLIALVESACGTGGALLHPARVLDDGELRGSVGMSRTFASGALHSLLRQARSNPPTTREGPSGNYLQGLLANAALAPGSSPWVAARIGLGAGFEAGLSHVGRATRLDGRHGWSDDEWTLSAGAGVSAIALEGDENVDELRWRARGFGADMPVLVGLQASQLLDVWAGARVSWERVSGDLNLRVEGAETQWSGWASRWAIGPIAGVRMGIPPISLHAELSAAHHWVDGDMSPRDTADDPPPTRLGLRVWSLSPSLSVSAKF